MFGRSLPQPNLPTRQDARMQLYTKILIGLLAGAVAGGVANIGGIEPLQALFSALEPIGTAFIRLITMIVIPLVVASLLVGTASLGDIRKLGRIGGKTLAYYMMTTAVAVTIGLVISQFVQPGARVDPTTRDELSARYGGEAAGRMEMAAEAPSWVDTLLNMIPRNPVQAAAELDLLPLIFFTIVFGAALSLVEPKRREVVLTFFEGVNEASMVIIDWVMKLAPYAVFALIASVVANFGLDLLRSLLVYSVTVTAGLLLHCFGTYALVVKFLARLNPLDFYKRVAKAPLVAFSTSSSNATLPVTMETAEEELGVSNEVASFVLPLGATINMDGTALYQAVAVMFIAQIYGIPLSFADQLVVVLTATLASVGAAGVPSAGIITLIIVLNSVGLQGQVQAGIAMILGVDRILDMLRTAVNVTGDLAASAVIARSEGEAGVWGRQPPPRGISGPARGLGPRLQRGCAACLDIGTLSGWRHCGADGRPGAATAAPHKHPPGRQARPAGAASIVLLG
ncbi:MAG: dicarboxylate/amino acid:cation symporter [Gemmatimonadetes bacterium]|nr:dicarboxylate/amino acid:cation symporter [Gemmatimonadota bacterium]